MLLQASAGGQLLNTSDVHVVAVASAIEPALCPSKLPGTRYQQFHKPAAISVGITAGLQALQGTHVIAVSINKVLARL